jgi:hypothetical protein
MMRREKPQKIVMPKDLRIHLGSARRLEPKLAASEGADTSYNQSRADTDYVAGIDALIHAEDPAMLPAQRLRYDLAPRGGDVFLEQQGMLTSYGIFGAPGSGKTHLYKYVLRQLLGLRHDDAERKYGALILDPKAALVTDLRQMLRMPDVDRANDLVVINAEELIQARGSVNVINCEVDVWALADLLVLAARSAGITASEDYWFLEWANLFGASLYLLNHFRLDGVSTPGDVVTLRQLLDALLLDDEEPGGAPSADLLAPGGRKPHQERPIQRLARRARRQLAVPGDAYVPAEVRADAPIAIAQIERFFRADYVHTIMAFVARAFGAFQRERYACFSPTGQTKGVRRRPFYDQIIDDGKIVLVSVSPADPLVAKMLCTLVKSLFQQTVMQRMDRYMSGSLDNFARPVLLACDEYAEVASEVPGQPMGDGRFFSLAREFGCMGLLATQSVNVLQATSLKESWRSVFSTFGAKVFMRLADNETAKEASDLAGTSTWYVTSRGTSHGKEGIGGSEQRSIQERQTLPTEVTTQGFMMGDAVAIGSLSGGASAELLHFFHVPEEREQETLIAAGITSVAHAPPAPAARFAGPHDFAPAPPTVATHAPPSHAPPSHAPPYAPPASPPAAPSTITFDED